VGYVMPATWPVALLAADAFASARFRGASRWWGASVAIAAATCLATVAGVAVNDNQSTRVLAQALRAQACEGDAVAYLHGAFYDVAFYARLQRPPYLLENWDDPRLTARDSWGREMADAGRFDPAAARSILLKPDALRTLVATRTVWVIAAQDVAQQYPLLAQAQPVAHQLGQVLLRLDPPAGAHPAGCRESPRGRALSDRGNLSPAFSQNQRTQEEVP
jgi:hypothetical protein